MNKGLSLWFAFSSIALLMATAITISDHGWWALLFAVLSILNMGFGFILKARLRRREASTASQ